MTRSNGPKIRLLMSAPSIMIASITANISEASTKSRPFSSNPPKQVKPMVGFEPTAAYLRNKCSTPELHRLVAFEDLADLLLTQRIINPNPAPVKRFLVDWMRGTACQKWELSLFPPGGACKFLLHYAQERTATKCHWREYSWRAFFQ